MGERSPRSQLETNATCDSTETQELEVFATLIGTSLPPTVELNHNGNGDRIVSQAQEERAVGLSYIKEMV